MTALALELMTASSLGLGSAGGKTGDATAARTSTHKYTSAVLS